MARQRREEVRPQQPAAADRAAAPGRHRQGALVLRAGASAAQAGTWARRLRRPLLDRPTSARADDLHRLCLSATPAPEGGGAGEKSWRPTDRRRRHRCLRSAAPSSPSCSLRLRFLIVARTATGGSLSMLLKCQGSDRQTSAPYPKTMRANSIKPSRTNMASSVMKPAPGPTTSPPFAGGG